MHRRYPQALRIGRFSAPDGINRRDTSSPDTVITVTIDNNLDSDGDGLLDIDELSDGTDPLPLSSEPAATAYPGEIDVFSKG